MHRGMLIGERARLSPSDRTTASIPSAMILSTRCFGTMSGARTGSVIVAHRVRAVHALLEGIVIGGERSWRRSLGNAHDIGVEVELLIPVRDDAGATRIRGSRIRVPVRIVSAISHFLRPFAAIFAIFFSPYFLRPTAAATASGLRAPPFLAAAATAANRPP